MSRTVKTILIILAVLLLFAFTAFSWVKQGYNRAVALDENVKGHWAQVENQLKRRYDLIPNLVQTVKGYAKHEKELFEHLADARTKYFQAKDVKGKIAASNQLEGVLSRLLLLKEQYPELKANQSFLKLQDSLEGTENRIAVERKRYNDAVQQLNTFTRTFFGRFFTAMAGVGKAEYYKIPEGEKAVPKVKF
ncbi:MAG: LemA family protein [Deltaproteobacteria bacterium]|nr:LemA family protein [Deltaproteobacteria bacterium]